MENFADIYTDYLISSVSYITATGLAALLSVKHDKITQSLAKGDYDSHFLWKSIKPYVQEMTQSSEPVFVSFDDSIEAKPYCDESELIGWHFDHSVNRTVKGVNFLSALVQTGGMRLPCAVDFVRRNKFETDLKTGRQKRVSEKTKNEMFREMVAGCHERFRFNYVLTDSWYCSAENMQLVKSLGVNFIMTLKSNRRAAVSREAKEAKDYISIGSLQPGRASRGGLAQRVGFSAVADKAGLQRRG